jgi:hypothetical protein
MGRGHGSKQAVPEGPLADRHALERAARLSHGEVKPTAFDHQRNATTPDRLVSEAGWDRVETLRFVVTGPLGDVGPGATVRYRIEGAGGELSGTIRARELGHTELNNVALPASGYVHLVVNDRGREYSADIEIGDRARGDISAATVHASAERLERHVTDTTMTTEHEGRGDDISWQVGRSDAARTEDRHHSGTDYRAEHTTTTGQSRELSREDQSVQSTEEGRRVSTGDQLGAGIPRAVDLQLQSERQFSQTDGTRESTTDRQATTRQAESTTRGESGGSVQDEQVRGRELGGNQSMSGRQGRDHDATRTHERRIDQNTPSRTMEGRIDIDRAPLPRRISDAGSSARTETRNETRPETREADRDRRTERIQVAQRTESRQTERTQVAQRTETQQTQTKTSRDGQA